MNLRAPFTAPTGSRSIRRKLGILRILFVVFIGMLIMGAILQTVRVETIRIVLAQERADASLAGDRASTREKALQGDIRSLGDQNRRLLIACQQSNDCLGKVPPQVIEGTPGAQGERGETGRGISYAVCRSDGTFVVAYTDGQTTEAGSCRGQTGASGTNGSNGSNGADGAAGQTGATGAQGDPGPQGPAGQDGRGITDATCGDDGRWTVTYTDGTSSDGGSCRSGLLG